MFEQELVGKPIQPGKIYLMGTVLKVRQRRSRAFVGAFGMGFVFLGNAKVFLV